MFTMYISPKSHPIISRFRGLRFPDQLRAVCFFLMFLYGSASPIYSETADHVTVRQQIVRLVSGGCVQLNDEYGREIFSYQPDVILIPASIIKILTAMVAFDELGESYRFKTEFYTKDSGELAIKGWGDPFLISEEIYLIAKTIYSSGIKSIRRLYIDDDAFSPDLNISGLSYSQNPYDALNGALVVNFNSLNIARDISGTIYSAEKETPLTPLVLKKARLLKPGTQERINLTDQPQESLQYAGELFSVFFEMAGIHITDKRISQTKIDESWQLIYTHYNTHQLTDIIQGLFRYSNNFIANQIFLATGISHSQPPATLKKSRLLFRKYLFKQFGDSAKGTVIDEASGISKNNRMNCRAMMRLLEAFRNHAHLLHEKNGVRLKSGTLTGIYNYAGYFQSQIGIQPFVIMTNQPKNHRDEILHLLDRYRKIRRSSGQYK